MKNFWKQNWKISENKNEKLLKTKMKNFWNKKNNKKFQINQILEQKKITIYKNLEVLWEFKVFLL